MRATSAAVLLGLVAGLAGLPGAAASTVPVTAPTIGSAAVHSTTTAAAEPAGAGFDGDPATTERLEAGNPVTSAVLASRARFDDGGAGHAVLSRDDTFVDSLAGAALTGDGPMLLTARDDLPEATADELRRAVRAGGTVYLLGGTAALDGGVERSVADLGYEPLRLAGASRVETSLAVAGEVRRLHPEQGWIAMARAYGSPGEPTSAWADSVTGGAWSAATATPIVVTTTDAVHPAVAAALAAWTPTRTVLLGGEVALSAAVETAAPNPLRVSGPERASTAVAIAAELWPAGTTRYLVVNGYRADGWAFGLPAAGLSAAAGAPILLTDTATVPEATMARLAVCGGPVTDLLLVGGPTVVGDGARARLDAADGGACALNGAATRIEADIEAAGGTGVTVACPAVLDLRRGDVHPCGIVPDDAERVRLRAVLLVRDDAGNVNYDFGTEVPATAAELGEEPGRSCEDLAGRGVAYHDAVLYWFFEATRDRLDPDGDGRPCETAYPAADLERFWDGGPVVARPAAPPSTLAFTGDLLTHSQVAGQAAAYGGATGAQYDFGPMLAQVAPVLSAADLAICHLETPLSADNTAISGYPRFNAPLELADGIAAAGWDGCSVASNHSLDLGAAGVSATLSNLDRVGVGHTGTARSPEERATPRVYEAGRVRLGHLSATYGTNGIPVPAGQPWLVDLIDAGRILADAAALRAAGADLVVVSLHWGEEYQPQPTAAQSTLAHQLLPSPDVDLIVGHHAHVVQPVERIGDEYVVYGLGNFLSGQLGGGRQDGAVVHITVAERPLRDGYAATGVTARPTWVDPGGWVVNDTAAGLSSTATAAALRAELEASQARTLGVLQGLGVEVPLTP